MKTETTILLRNNRAIAGMILIAIAIVLPVSYIVNSNSGLLVLPVLVIIFAGVGIRMHESG